MTHGIHKFTLERGVTPQKIHVNAGSDILYAREQGDKICVWFRFPLSSYDYRGGEPSNITAIEQKWIVLARTGHDEVPGPDKSRYLGSAHLDDGNFIVHVFELTDVWQGTARR